MFPTQSSLSTLRQVVPMEKIRANASAADGAAKPKGVDLYLRFAFAGIYRILIFTFRLCFLTE